MSRLKLKACSIASFIFIAFSAGSDAAVRTSISEIGNSVYVTQVTTDQFGNSYSTTQKFDRNVYYAEMQRQRYMQWYNSLNPAQRAKVNAQGMINNSINAGQYQMQQDYRMMGGR